jgi:hypothetical protein
MSRDFFQRDIDSRFFVAVETFQPIFGWAFFTTNKLISRAFFVRNAILH